MIKLNYIVLQKLEGREMEDIAYSFCEADKILYRWKMLDSPEFGYDKTRIEIMYQNGDTLVFRFDLSKNSNIDLSNFVKNELKTYVGLRKPYSLTEEQYQEFIRTYTIEEQREKIKEILENYQLEDWKNPLFLFKIVWIFLKYKLYFSEDFYKKSIDL